jgi:hypothetical protein
MERDKVGAGGLSSNEMKRDDRLIPRSLQVHRQAHQSPIFLHLHLWMHAMIVSKLLRISSSTSYSQNSKRLRLYSTVLSPPPCDGLPWRSPCLQQQQSQSVCADPCLLSLTTSCPAPNPTPAVVSPARSPHPQAVPPRPPTPPRTCGATLCARSGTSSSSAT